MNRGLIKEYATYGNHQFNKDNAEYIIEKQKQFKLDGYEVYMDDVLSRGERLYNNEAELYALVDVLKQRKVKRLHCSYWAYPTSFIGGYNFGELVDRFGSINAVTAYYGDLTGEHMYKRWVEEYTLAKEMGAKAYTFHLIDYAPIDGYWDFTIDKNIIRNFMVGFLQKLLNLLIEKKLLDETSPFIELETSGWGLEYGIQSADDYLLVFNQIFDPFNKVKVAWEMNHLLHAVGYDEKEKTAKFFLQNYEKSNEMIYLEKTYGKKPQQFVEKWIQSQICHPHLIDKIGSLHLSDNSFKRINYFTNGKLREKDFNEIRNLDTWDEKEMYGVEIVLRNYDNHQVLGTGVYRKAFLHELLEIIFKENKEFVLLHELKNANALEKDLKSQLDFLWEK
ncbi:MAG: hypothetical protein ACK5KR_05415 [Breznakia sp.]